MIAKLRLGIAALCLLASGCTLSHNLSQTAVVQPIQYSNYFDEMLERHQFRKMARVELERARSAARAESDDYSCPPFSIDHERGFENGFVDYLIYGGPGHPPPLPPRRYWWSDCQSLGGCNAIQDWFRGFEHGAAVAEASGYRNCVTVQLGDSLVRDTVPRYINPSPVMVPSQPPPDAKTEPELVHDLQAAFMVQETESATTVSQASATAASAPTPSLGVAVYPALIERED